MNGRVYLPELGVFLSPDPFLQFPESTQGYNRYAYVSNNPLSYTDPSGHFIQFLKAALFIYNMFQSYQAGGFSGLIKGFLLNAISAGMANSIGGAFGDMAIANFKQGVTSAIQLTASQVAQKAVLHGITQGLLSAAGGGRFKDGFLGGAAGSLAEQMPLSENSNVRTIQTIVIGGTVSRLGGGKFATGAVSAAFVDLYNRLGEGHGEGSGKPNSGNKEQDRPAVSDQEVDELLGDPEFRYALYDGLATARNQAGARHPQNPAGLVIYNREGYPRGRYTHPEVLTTGHDFHVDVTREAEGPAHFIRNEALIIGVVPGYRWRRANYSALARLTNTPVLIIGTGRFTGENRLYYPSGNVGKWRP